MSDQAVRTTWGFVRRATFARTAPARDAPAVGMVKTVSPFGSRDVVGVLDRAHRDGEDWLRIVVPEQSNGTSGWVRAETLSELRSTDRALTIDTTALRARLVRGDRELWSGPIGVGTDTWPTTLGTFYVRARMIPSRTMPLYGAFAFCTSCIAPEPWPGARYLAIHGTNRPELIPGRVSKGCVRLRDEDVLRLRPLLPLGARVSIV